MFRICFWASWIRIRNYFVRIQILLSTRKINLIKPCFLLFNDFFLTLSMKTDVNASKISSRNFFFFCHLKATDGKSRIPIRKSSVRIPRSGYENVTDPEHWFLHIVMQFNGSFEIFFFKGEWRTVTMLPSSRWVLTLNLETGETLKKFLLFFMIITIGSVPHLEILQVHEFSWWCEDWPSSGRHGCLCSSPWYVNLF